MSTLHGISVAPPAPLAGRVLLVSGAHGGLGSAFSHAAAAAGATLVLLGRRVPKLGRLSDAIEQAGHAAPLLYPLDMEGATPTDYAELVERIESETGRLDGLVHCAAEFKGLASIENGEPLDLARALHVNLTAPLLLTRACLPFLRKAADGVVLFPLDAEDIGERAYWGGYGLAKTALATAVPLLAAEWGDAPPRVHGLRPGPMRTPLRARAWFAEDPAQWPEPQDVVVPAMLALIRNAGDVPHGGVLDLRQAAVDA